MDFVLSPKILMESAYELRNIMELDYDTDELLQRIRDARWNSTAVCPNCGSSSTNKRGWGYRDARRYKCKDCETFFKDFTDTPFEHRTMTLEEIFYIIENVDTKEGNEIADDIDRRIEPVLNLIDEFENSDIDMETLKGK